MVVGVEGYHLESRLFGEQGMFGTLDESLDFADGYFLGKAIGTFLQHRHSSAYACIASDAHPLSLPLESEVVRGLLECGVRVLAFAISPTPLVRFAATELRAQVALSVSRGSNPETHSGVKIFLEGSPLDAPRALQLRNIAANGIWRKNSHGRAGGRLVKSEGVNAYLTRLFAASAWRHNGDLKGGVGKEARYKLPRVLLAQGAHGASEEVLATMAENLSPHAEQVLVLENAAALHLALREGREQVGFLFNSDGTALQAFVGGRGEIASEELFDVLLREEEVSAGRRVVLADGFVGRRAVRRWETSGVRVVRCSEFGAGLLTCLLSKEGGAKEEVAGGGDASSSSSSSFCATFSSDGHMAFGASYYPFEDAFYVALRFLSAVALGKVRLDALHVLPERGVSGLLRILVVKAQAEGGVLNNKDGLLRGLRAYVGSCGVEGDEGDGDAGGAFYSAAYPAASPSTEEVERRLSDGRWLVRVSRFEDGLVARCEGEDEAAMKRAQEDLRAALSSCEIAFEMSSFVLS